MTSTQNRPALNGVDVPMLFATLDTVRAQPAAAQFQFRAKNQWISGTHSRSTIQGFFGAGMEDGTRATPFIYDAESATSRPLAASSCTGSNPPSRAISTCWASSDCPIPSGTVTGRSG